MSLVSLERHAPKREAPSWRLFFFATFVGRTLVRKLAASRGFRNLNPVRAAQIREGLES